MKEGENNQEVNALKSQGTWLRRGVLGNIGNEVDQILDAFHAKMVLCKHF